MHKTVNHSSLFLLHYLQILGYRLKISFRKILFIFFLLFSVSSFSQVKLPKLISDGMILQRNTHVKIWGWAAGNEKVTVDFNNQVYHAIANTNGEWQIILPEFKAGGPFAMTIKASNTITINDILIGDVWLCSGQSNMEYPTERLTHIYGKEIEASTNTNIRQFLVPQKYDFHSPQTDFQSGKWISVNPTTILKFSAIAYFYANELYQKYHVPIGLINNALGGSPIEAWISEDAIKKFPAYYNELQKFKNDALVRKIDSTDNATARSWNRLLMSKDEGRKSNAMPWTSPDLNTSDWAEMNIPGYWNKELIGAVNGIVWFRKEFTVPAQLNEKQALLLMGREVDADSVFINDRFVGTTSYQYPQRRYTVPANILKEGKNLIVVKVTNNSGAGGFVLDKPYELQAGAVTIDLKGKWKYKLGAKMDPMPGSTTLRWKPVGLYNSMIAPLENYGIKGVIWYQGESNAGHAVEYRALLPALINDWRSHWKQGDFPFLYVQLPNFMEVKEQPSESDWAMLRESQLKTLSVPQTGMVVAIDLGEWNDVHPVHKLEVGHRLALCAQNVAYGDHKTISSGPVYQSFKTAGDKVILTFNNIGGGLVAKGDLLKQFSIAGSDKKFVWANAKIENNKVVVWSEKVSHPVSVRYAWADNPYGANLYNKEGLPASPFRTDE